MSSWMQPCRAPRPRSGCSSKRGARHGCIHELIHRPSFTELYHARAVLLFSNYNHFWIEHLWGHHKRVATDEDPASSALNEPFWTFIWVCLYRSFVSACHLEAKFLSNQVSLVAFGQPNFVA